VTRPQYEAGRSKRGALLVGDPNEVAEKILFEHSLFRNDRFLMQIDMGSLPHGETLKAIELFAGKVAPQVRKALRTAGLTATPAIG
jgi:alkanesulfonate monooxygenase SsuD/methylene tetrahydromethanopterin reductase-like flavin-dependent oxidoreductase (luciferase family)